MKHYFFIFAAALLCVTCVMCDKSAKEGGEGEVPSDAENVTFVLSGGGVDYASNDLGTKSGWDGSKVVWAAGDAIKMGVTVDGAWQGVSEDGAVAPTLFVSAPLEEGGADAQFSVQAQVCGGSPYRFYTAYPAAVFDSAIETDGDARAKVRFTIPTEQAPSYAVNTTAFSFDRRTDIMTGVSDKFNERPTGPVPIRWKHQVAHGEITLKNLSGLTSGEVVKSVVLTAQSGAQLTGKYELNLFNGDVTAISGQTSNSVTVQGGQLRFNEAGDLNFWISILPGSITALTVTVKTVNAEGYPVTYSLGKSSLNLNFAANAHNTLNLNVSGATRTVGTEPLGPTYFVKVEKPLNDWTGQYLIVYEEDALALDGSAVRDESGNYVEVTIDNGKILADDVTIPLRFTVAASAGKYTIKGTDGNYIGRIAATNGFDISQAPLSNQFGYSEEKECFDIIGEGGPFLRYNSDWKGFRYYKQRGQRAIQLYKLEIESGGSSSGPDMGVDIVTGTAGSVTTTSAVLYATYSNPTDNVREVGFEWGTSSSALTEVLQASTAASPFSATLDGLAGDITYWYRAYVILQRDNDIQTFRGSIKSFKTVKDEDVPDPQPGSDLGWYELPVMNIQKTSDGYHVNSEDNTEYYAWHMCTGGEKGPGGKTAHNYTVCYSSTHHCTVWVAAPRHSMYVGSANRTNAYRQDPLIPANIQYSSKSTGGGCNKGHMLGSAERTSTSNTNRDVFYYPNIAPQLSSGFNTGGGGWNTLEDWVDGQVCADTLYEVVGCYFKEFSHTYNKGTDKSPQLITVSQSPSIISFGSRSDVSMPTMFYYVLLRTKSGNSHKALKDCTSSELKCAAFVRTHSNNLKGVDVTSYDMMSVSELEQLVGVTFFPNVPAAPKSVANASDWGL